MMHFANVEFLTISCGRLTANVCEALEEVRDRLKKDARDDGISLLLYISYNCVSEIKSVQHEENEKEGKPVARSKMERAARTTELLEGRGKRVARCSRGSRAETTELLVEQATRKEKRPSCSFARAIREPTSYSSARELRVARRLASFE